MLLHASKKQATKIADFDEIGDQRIFIVEKGVYYLGDSRVILSSSPQNVQQLLP